MTVKFLDLPTEIHIRILCLLEPTTIFSVGLTNSRLHDIIFSHQIIQYHVLKSHASVIENTCGVRSIPISDRFTLLQRREKGWEKLHIDFQESVPVLHNPSGIYDVGGGIYLMGNKDRQTLHYLKLPRECMEGREVNQETKWQKIDVGMQLIDMALALYEHDLIAIVTSTPSTSNEGTHYIEILLLEFSTGRLHPQAKNPLIRVCESPRPYPSIALEIVGNNLALILTYSTNRFRPNDGFYIFDWKCGILKMVVSVAYQTYAGLVFLSPNILLLPNMRVNTLDLWVVPDTSAEAITRPIRSLGLPAIKGLHFLMMISCRGEPNPVGSEIIQKNEPGYLANGDKIKFSKELFHTKSEDALVLFNIRIQELVGVMGNSMFSFFAHRNALLNLVPDAPDRPRQFNMRATDIRSSQTVGAPTAIHAGTESESESDVDSEDEMWTELDGPIHPETINTSQTTLTSDDPSIATNNNLDTQAWPHPVPWDTWGPSITRWFDTDEVPTRWITTSAGQRAVIYSEGDPEAGEPPSLSLFDFNPAIVAKEMKRLGSRVSQRKNGGPVNGPGGTEVCEEEEEGRETEIMVGTTELVADIFERPVRSSLPFKRLTVVGFPFYDGVLMDEECLIGLKVSPDSDKIVDVEIMHIGDAEEKVSTPTAS